MCTLCREKNHMMQNYGLANLSLWSIKKLCQVYKVIISYCVGLFKINTYTPQLTYNFAISYINIWFYWWMCEQIPTDLYCLHVLVAPRSVPLGGHYILPWFRVWEGTYGMFFFRVIQVPHDDVMTKAHFLHYRLFARGIHQWMLWCCLHG